MVIFLMLNLYNEDAIDTISTGTVLDHFIILFYIYYYITLRCYRPQQSNNKKFY